MSAEVEDMLDDIVPDWADDIEEESEAKADDVSDEREDPEESDDEKSDDDERQAADADEQDEDQTDDEAEPIETLTELAEALGASSVEDMLTKFTHTAVVDGESQEVSLQEALNGYQRQAHYQSMVMEHKQAQQAFTQEQAQFQQQQQEQLLQHGQWLQQVKDTVQQQLTNPEMQALMQSQDPADRLRALEMQQQHQVTMQTLGQLEQQAAQQWSTNQDQAKLQQEQYQQNYLQEQQALLLSKMPDWGQDKFSAISDNLVANGFSADEVQTIGDHRMMLVAHKAMLWDQSQKDATTAQKKVKTLPKLTKPGKKASRGEGKRSNQRAKMAKLRKSGRLEDGAAAIEHLLEDD